MPRPRTYTECIDCGRPPTRRRTISTRGLCVECATRRETEAIISINQRSGPAYERWLAGMAAAIDKAAQQYLPGTTGGTPSTTSERVAS